jgi:hypothetical protein
MTFFAFLCRDATIEHLAGVNDLRLPRATFAAAVKRWPGAKITLRNGARIIEKTWPADD